MWHNSWPPSPYWSHGFLFWDILHADWPAMTSFIKHDLNSWPNFWCQYYLYIQQVVWLIWFWLQMNWGRGGLQLSLILLSRNVTIITIIWIAHTPARDQSIHCMHCMCHRENIWHQHLLNVLWVIDIYVNIYCASALVLSRVLNSTWNTVKFLVGVQ